MPRRRSTARRPLDVRSARLRCESELEVFSLRGFKDSALFDALKTARDALQLYEEAEGKATAQVWAHLNVARDVCAAELARVADSPADSVVSTLSEARRTLDDLWNAIDIRLGMGTMGRNTLTGGGRLGGRSRGPYR